MKTLEGLDFGENTEDTEEPTQSEETDFKCEGDFLLCRSLNVYMPPMTGLLLNKTKKNTSYL